MGTSVSIAEEGEPGGPDVHWVQSSHPGAPGTLVHLVPSCAWCSKVPGTRRYLVPIVNLIYAELNSYHEEFGVQWWTSIMSNHHCEPVWFTWLLSLWVRCSCLKPKFTSSKAKGATINKHLTIWFKLWKLPKYLKNYDFLFSNFLESSPDFL